MKKIIQLTLFFLLILMVAACDPQEQPESVVNVVEVTATPAPTAVPTASAEPTAVPDHLAVTVPDNLASFPPGAALALHFNQPMDTRLAQPLTFSPAVRGTAVWNEDATTLTFTPDEGFSPNRAYVLSIPTTLHSASDQSFDEAQRWHMKTLDAPLLIERIPSDPAITDRQPTIILRFNQAMDAHSTAAALSITPALAYDLTVADNEATLTLTEPLAFGTEYQFTLAKTAANQDGLPMARNYTWELRLQETLAAVTGPSINNLQAPITIRFHYPMDDASVSSALNLEPAINGKLTWNNDYTVATLSPDKWLSADVTYTISFDSALQDRAGNELPLPPPADFHTPPSTLSFTAASDRVSLGATVQIRFDRPMNKTATEAAFTIEPAIEGTFEWQETSLIFRPTDGFFAENSTYHVTLADTAVSADGDPVLKEAIIWSFTVGRYNEAANFGYGPNAQVLDANGRRAVRYQVLTGASQKIGFELYQLNLEQFLDRYASNFRNWWPRGEEGKIYINLSGIERVQSWQEQTVVHAAEGINIQEVIIPADVPPGLYILNLNVGRINDQLILVLTENSLVVKEADRQIVTWVTDINGDPLPGADIGVYARNGSLLTAGKADDSGIFRTQLPTFAAGGPPAVEPLIVVARHGDDVTVSGLSSEWQSSYGYRHRWGESGDVNRSAAFITTDRPIYKPGHDVHFKAVVRWDNDAVLTLPPAGTAVTVRIRDGRDNVVQTFELTTNDFGTVHGTFHLAEGAMLGSYHVEVEMAGTRHRQLFKVEDYRKPDYEVTAVTDADKYLLGDTIQVTIDTAYYFGEPVPDATVTIRRFLQELEWYGNGATWYEDYNSMDRPITGRTDADGRFTTTIPIPQDSYVSNQYNSYWSWGSSLGSTRWGIEATVDDGSHQTVSGFTAVTLYDALEVIDANFGSYVQAPGQPFIISANVNTVFGEPVANRRLTVELARWARDGNDYIDVRQTASLTTNAQGRASTEFTIAEPGFYQLRLVGTDAHGHKIRYTEYVYAFSDFYENWVGRGDSDVRIDTDKPTYAPGETAQLIIESTLSGPALLTIERGTTRREQLIQLTAPLTLVDLPIEATDVPNVYVAVNIWQPLDTTIQEYTSNSLPDGRLVTVHHNISVPAATKQLNVTITPDKTQYAPREAATFTVRVTNYQGEPVSAELSLALVDEAIFALSPELSGPMYDAFYYERNSLVSTYNSLLPFRAMAESGWDGNSSDSPPPGSPRANFLDTAAWLPVLHTDFNGEVKVTLTLPDSLTTWRLTAKAITADTQVGEATATITTWQPIIARATMPGVSFYSVLGS